MSKNRLFIFVNILILIGSLFLIGYIGNKIDERFLEYAEIEATKIAKYIVNKATSKEMLKNINVNTMITTTKNKEEEIKSIEFNPIEVNALLEKITSDIHVMFKEFENGTSNIIDLSENILTNTKIKGYKGGIVFEIPLGLATNNFILSNFGPKIPIKLSITGEIESNISTSVVEYGINNALITMYINIHVSEQILMPFKTKRITINQKIPIAISIVNGKVPNYYIGGMNTNSLLYNLPVE